MTNENQTLDYYDIDFINHCDHETCDLGYAEFECPHCQAINYDYTDLWFDRYDLKFPFETSCEACKQKIIIIKEHI
jgi:hypothetical protein